MNLKYLILSFFVVLVIFSCEVNEQKVDNKSDDLYVKNLATAKKFFELFKTEDSEAQNHLYVRNPLPTFYGSQPVKYDGLHLETKLGWITLMTSPMMLEFGYQVQTH